MRLSPRFFESCCDGSLVFEFVEETLDSILLAEDRSAEVERFRPVRHGAKVGPGSVPGNLSAKGAAVIGKVG